MLTNQPISYDYDLCVGNGSFAALLGGLGHAKTKKYLVEDDQAKHFIVETEAESPWERDLDPPPISDINFAESPEEEDPAQSEGVQNRIASGNWLGTGGILCMLPTFPHL